MEIQTSLCELEYGQTDARQFGIINTFQLSFKVLKRDVLIFMMVLMIIKKYDRSTEIKEQIPNELKNNFNH